MGSNETQRADVRIVAATHRDLQRMTDEGSFRLDLFYRLNVVPVRVPPLRDCPEDVVPLARRFLADLGADVELTPAQQALIASYSWPGNVRQLRNAVERLTVTGELLDGGWAADSEDEVLGDFRRAKSEALDQFESLYLTALLQQHQGNLSAAARASGLVRHHLRKLLKKHGITPATWKR